MANLGYFSPVLSFVAVVAALLGPTRREGESGLAAITTFGWAMIIIALLSLAVSLLRVRQQAGETNAAREAAIEAERKAAGLEAVTNRRLRPGVGALREALDFAFLLSQLSDPTDPGSIPEGSAEPRSPVENPAVRELRSLPLDSIRRLEGLKSFSYLPLQSFEIDVLTQMLSRRADVLDAEDPYGTGMPFAMDTRLFPVLIADECARAANLLSEALASPGYAAFDHEVLSLTNEVLDHSALKALIEFPPAIERYLAIEDWGDEAAADAGVRISLVIDGGVHVGVSAGDYLDFAHALGELQAKVWA